MSWYKKAQTNIPTLLTDINNTNQRPIVYVAGDTYPIRQHIKALGFTWYGKRKMWWMYRDRFDTNLERNVTSLQQAGVNTTSVDSPQTPQEQPGSPQEAQPIEEQQQTDLTIKTDQTTDVKNYHGTGFPINPDIYHTDMEVDHNGQPVIITVQLGREIDDKYHKTMPKYRTTIFWNGKKIYDAKLRSPKRNRWSRSGPNYDENQLITNYLSKIPESASDPRTPIYAALEYELAAKNRDPDFETLLQKIQDSTYGEKFPDIFPDRTIIIDTPGYEGQYLVSITPYVFLENRIVSLELSTNIEHKLAPRPDILIRYDLPPNIKNVQEANVSLNQFITQNQDKIQKKYVKYLQSFAYTEQQQEQGQQDLQPIADMIASGSVNTGFIRNELLKRQYIRPSKHGKRNVTPGMAPADSFKFIIDDKAIRNATFGGDFNSPEYFYTAIAYNLMRIKHNNISFMPINLDDAYRRVASMLKRYYDPNIKATDVAEYINNAARAVYQDLTGNEYKNWEEVYNDFYSGSFNSDSYSGQQEQPGNAEQNFQQSYAVKTFANFVASLNMGFTPEQAIENPKAVYRQLSLIVHPDTTQLDPEQAQKIFSEMSVIYNSISQEIRNACNWYKKVKLSSI